MPPDLLVLADDLTGALEVGAKLGRPVGFGLPASIIDTETRHLSPQEAQAKIRAILREARPGRIYKKTDSTLRGNIAAELSAIAAAYPNEPIHYIPAYPKMGRTVRDARLHVWGVAGARIPDMLNVIIHDGEIDEHVAAAVRAAGRIICGPAAIADYIAPPVAPPPLPKIRSCLVVNGSLQEVSARQIAHAAARGWRIVDTREFESAISECPWLILRLDHARASAATICNILNRTNVDALTVFGGDTAYAVIQTLGEQTIMPVAEVVPGGAPVAPEKNVPDHQGRRFRRNPRPQRNPAILNIMICVHPRSSAAKKMPPLPYGITIGDPSGVGPEILLKATTEYPIVAYGDTEVLEYYNDLQVPLRKIAAPADYEPGALNVIDLGIMRREDVRPGQLDRKSGHAAREYVIAATRAALA